MVDIFYDTLEMATMSRQRPVMFDTMCLCNKERVGGVILGKAERIGYQCYHALIYIRIIPLFVSVFVAFVLNIADEGLLPHLFLLHFVKLTYT